MVQSFNVVGFGFRCYWFGVSGVVCVVWVFGVCCLRRVSVLEGIQGYFLGLRRVWGSVPFARALFLMGLYDSVCLLRLLSDPSPCIPNPINTKIPSLKL